MRNPFWEQYSSFEDELRRCFHEHRVYNYLGGMSDDEFRRYLLQIGFIAREFVKWYEVAKQGLTSERAKEVVRTILRDEIPQVGPTHQDDRLFDLSMMGVTPFEVLNVRPTVNTGNTIERLYRLVRVPQNDQDLRIMITLRVAGEVLVSEQYKHIVEEMGRRFAIKPEQSRFYAPHYLHDMKGGSEQEGSAGHTDAFDELLESMVTDQRTLSVAKDQARKAFNVRGSIQDQFLPAQKVIRAIEAICQAAAVALLLVVGGSYIQKGTVQQERESWASFVASLAPSARTFYLACDQQLLVRVQRTGDVKDLPKVGTSEACREVW